MSHTNQIGYLLMHVSSMMAQHSEQVLQEQLGIGLAQFKILRDLMTQPRITQREVALHLGQTEASISRQIKLMLELGLVHSLRHPEDHREHLTIVTPKGERLVDAAIAALERYHLPSVNALSEKQQGQLIAELEVLHQQLCHGVHADTVQ